MQSDIPAAPFRRQPTTETRRRPRQPAHLNRVLGGHRGTFAAMRRELDPVRRRAVAIGRLVAAAFDLDAMWDEDQIVEECARLTRDARALLNAHPNRVLGQADDVEVRRLADGCSVEGVRPDGVRWFIHVDEFDGTLTLSGEVPTRAHLNVIPPHWVVWDRQGRPLGYRVPQDQRPVGLPPRARDRCGVRSRGRRSTGARASSRAGPDDGGGSDPDPAAGLAPSPRRAKTPGGWR